MPASPSYLTSTLAFVGKDLRLALLRRTIRNVECEDEADA